MKKIDYEKFVKGMHPEKSKGKISHTRNYSAFGSNSNLKENSKFINCNELLEKAKLQINDQKNFTKPKIEFSKVNNGVGKGFSFENSILRKRNSFINQTDKENKFEEDQAMKTQNTKKHRRELSHPTNLDQIVKESYQVEVVEKISHKREGSFQNFLQNFANQNGKKLNPKNLKGGSPDGSIKSSIGQGRQGSATSFSPNPSKHRGGNFNGELLGRHKKSSSFIDNEKLQPHVFTVSNILEEKKNRSSSYTDNQTKQFTKFLDLAQKFQPTDKTPPPNLFKDVPKAPRKNGPHSRMGSFAEYLEGVTIEKEKDKEELKPLRVFAESNSSSVGKIVPIIREMIENYEKVKAFYSINPNYLERLSGISPIMRAILIDWIMEVSAEFLLKRQTFHLAVYLLDKYLSIQERINKRELQLIGSTCLFLASKIEEIYPPKAKDFCKAANGSFTDESLIELELIILDKLQYRCTPPSHGYLLGLVTNLWDNFAEKLESPYRIFFRQPNENSYAVFRKAYQILDTILLDIDHLRFEGIQLILAIVFLVVCLESEDISLAAIKNIRTRLPNAKSLLIPLFGDFSKSTTNVEFCEIIFCVSYVSMFFELELKLELPGSAKANKELFLKGHFEDFLSLQTHNQNSLKFIKEKLK